MTAILMSVTFCKRFVEFSSLSSVISSSSEHIQDLSLEINSSDEIYNDDHVFGLLWAEDGVEAWWVATCNMKLRCGWFIQILVWCCRWLRQRFNANFCWIYFIALTWWIFYLFPVLTTFFFFIDISCYICMIFSLF